MTIFDSTNPARDIKELLSFLKSSDNGNYCYRGQLKHYAEFVPSLYRRPVMTGNVLPDLHSLPPHLSTLQILEVDPDEYSKRVASEPYTQRARLRDGLIAVLGRGIGNIIAQQYGADSETLDVTNDPEVAAFFATRKYPDYSAFSGSQTKEPGVIYRIPIQDRVDTLAKLESRLGSVGHFHKELGEPVWFSMHAREEDLSIEQQDKLQRYFQELGREQAPLYTAPILVNYDACRSLVQDAMYRVNKFKSRAMDNTRIARQQGGFFRPAIHLWCSIPRQRDFVQRGYLLARNEYVPDLAVVESVVGIDNVVHGYPIESFFFRHTDVQIDTFTREYLWPSSAEDDIYALIKQQVRWDRQMSEYVERENIQMDDLKKGVVSRGYSSGDEGV